MITEVKQIAEKKAREEELAILKYQALVKAEMWCDSHGVSKTLIRETESGYQVIKSFNI